MRHLTFLFVVAILALTSSAARAADNMPRACSLLTAGEVVAVAGGTGASQESDLPVPQGGSKADAMTMCMWAAANHGMVSLSIVAAAHGPEREASLAKIQAVFDRMKAQGWQEEKKAFDNETCLVMTPPKNSGTAPRAMTGCFGEAKGLAISVGYTGPGTIAIDRMKSLLDRALGRLP
jgi:hypothetical protein